MTVCHPSDAEGGFTVQLVQVIDSCLRGLEELVAGRFLALAGIALLVLVLEGLPVRVRDGGHRQGKNSPG